VPSLITNRSANKGLPQASVAEIARGGTTFELSTASVILTPNRDPDLDLAPQKAATNEIMIKS